VAPPPRLLDGDTPTYKNICNKKLIVDTKFKQTGGDYMQMLQEVDIFVVSDPDCEAVHSGNPHPSNICAGVPEGGQGHCKVILFKF